MPPEKSNHEIVTVTGVSNEEFLARYAGPGRIGLSGGFTLLDKAICRAQRHLDDAKKWGSWSHSFLFQGVRADGHHWVVESDMQIHHKHIQFGVQENRVSKYYDEHLYGNLGVMDLGLSDEVVTNLLREALELVANRARYSLRELFGTLIALKHPGLRGRDNLLAREKSLYCSALVQYLFRKAGLDLAPGVDGKNTTPEDIARTSIPHTTYLLQREAPPNKLHEMRMRLHGKVSARLKRLKHRSEPSVGI